MTLSPTKHAPPLQYPTAGPFQAPTSTQTFSDVTKRIAVFSQESLVTLGTRILWAIWSEPELLAESSGPLNEARNVTALFASRIIALACVYAGNDAPPAEEQHFVLLCWELHNLVDAELRRPETLKAIGQRMAAPGSEMMKRIARLDHVDVRREAMIARIMATNLSVRWRGFDDIIRPLAIAQLFCAALRNRCGELVQKRYDAILGSTVDNFFRNGLVVHALAENGITVVPEGGGAPMHERGLFHLGDDAISEDLSQTLGVTVGSLRAFVLRLSRPIDTADDLRHELEKLPEQERVHAHQSDWLSRWPLLDLGVDGIARRILTASPRHFISAIQTFLLYNLPDELIRNGVTTVQGVPLNHKDVTSDRGSAYAEYLGVAVGGQELHNIDHLVKHADPGKRPDFAWLGEKFGLLIEAKFTLMPSIDRAISNPSAMIASWERAADALQQIVDFRHNLPAQLRDGLPGNLRWVAVIVTHDSFPDLIRFNAIAKRAQLLDNTGIEALAVLSTNELEDWVHHGNADSLATACLENWRALDSSDITTVAQSILRPTHAIGLLPHLRAALEQILPRSSEELLARMRQQPS
jgi:hypothetical protein